MNIIHIILLVLSIILLIDGILGALTYFGILNFHFIKKFIKDISKNLLVVLIIVEIIVGLALLSLAF